MCVIIENYSVFSRASVRNFSTFKRDIRSGTLPHVERANIRRKERNARQMILLYTRVSIIVNCFFFFCQSKNITPYKCKYTPRKLRTNVFSA